MDATLQFLKELVETHGVPGFEREVAAVMEKRLKGVGTISKDRLVDTLAQLFRRHTRLKLHRQSVHHERGFFFQLAGHGRTVCA